MNADLIDTLEPPHPADARLEEDTRLDRRELAGTLAHIRDLKDEIKAMEDELEILTGHLRTALEDDREPIVDGEHGLVATLIERSKGAEVDLISFAKRPDAERLLREAAEQGVLTARVTQLRGLAGRSEAADALLSVAAPGGVSYVLQIQEAK